MDPRVTELHCIMPIANIESVVELGILSYERAARLKHRSIAMQPVQERRDRTQVPGGLKLHRYANLYFHARNPMMFKRRGEALDLCVIRVSPDIFHLDGSVISDRNAASAYARFLHPKQWNELDFDAIYAMDWRHPGDEIAYRRHKAQKCAEVLVPHRVEPRFMTGAYVANDVAAVRLMSAGFSWPVSSNPQLFFR